MRNFIPLYIGMILALIAVLLWLEREIENNTASEKEQTTNIAAKKKRKYWSFLPPVAYVIRG